MTPAPVLPSALAGRRSPHSATRPVVALAVLPLVLAMIIFSAATVYQLQLPGLHYDEAKEAGVNAMQLLTGQPVTAFRDATVRIGSLRIPLMVQDYIGNLNVLLAVPFLAVGGINTVALRALPLVLAALTLFLTWKIAVRLGGPWAGAAAALLLAVNPSFVFWSRQGIFVTNITALFFVAALWFGLLWWESRRGRYLVLVALACGLGVYAKLLFVWVALALFVIGLAALVWARRRRPGAGDWPGARTLACAALAFLLPLTPLILFNLQTGGTFTSVFGHLGRSYYGVDNSAYASNLLVRLRQVVAVLRGDQFWYLGGVHADGAAPFLLLGSILLAGVLWLRWRSRTPAAERRFFTPALPIALLILIVLQSAFTVSDLFVTHFAVLTPLMPLAAGLALGEGMRWAKGQGWLHKGIPLVVLALLAAIWAGADAYTVVRYHQALTLSGGFSSHSDAIYQLAGYLDKQGYSSPVALDWGIDAPVCFLTAGRVQPVDVFGYDVIDSPDAGFMDRITPYLDNRETVWVVHSADKTVFKGRQEAIEALTANGAEWLEQIRFGQRSGETVFIVHRFFR